MTAASDYLTDVHVRSLLEADIIPRIDVRASLT